MTVNGKGLSPAKKERECGAEALALDALRKHNPWSMECFEHGAIPSRLQAPRAAILVIQMWESFVALTKDFFQG